MPVLKRLITLTALAAVLGILGWEQVSGGPMPLMDRYPQRLKTEDEDEIILKVQGTARSWPWVSRRRCGLGDLRSGLFWAVAVVPEGEIDLDDIARGYNELRNLHWKIYDFTIDPVRKLPPW